MSENTLFFRYSGVLFLALFDRTTVAGSSGSGGGGGSRYAVVATMEARLCALL